MRNDRIKSVFGNGAPSKATIYNLIKEFFPDYKSMCDDVLNGRQEVL